MEKKKNNNGIFYVVISLLAVLGIAGGVIYAYNSSQTVNVSGGGVYNYNEAGQLSQPTEENLGALPGGDIYSPVTFYDTFGYGDGRNKTEYFYKVIDFTDATITPAVFQPDVSGFNDFYLVDLWLENTSKATSTVRICVTTTTATFLSGDVTTYLDADAGNCTLMRTLGNAFGADGASYNSLTATSSAFDWEVYPGTDTLLAAQKLPILINSSTNIAVFATSSGGTNFGIVGTGNTFNGRLHIVGRESDR